MWQQQNHFGTIATKLPAYPNVAIKSLKKVILKEDLLKKVILEEEFLELHAITRNKQSIASTFLN